jgi:hypothetical protein
MKNKIETQAYAEKWLKIIKQEPLPDRDLGEWIINESVYNFKEYFNK